MTKEDQVLKHFLSGHNLSCLEALQKFNTMSLKDIVYKLRNKGYSIIDSRIKNENTGAYYKRYYLARKF